MKGIQFRMIAVGLFVAVFAFLSLANFVPEERRIESPLLPDGGLRLGLDLRGGIHWVLGVKLEAAVDHELEYLAGSLADAAEQDGFEVGDIDAENQQLTVATPSPESATKVRDWADQSNTLSEASASDEQIVYTLSRDWTKEVEELSKAVVVGKVGNGDPQEKSIV